MTVPSDNGQRHEFAMEMGSRVVNFRCESLDGHELSRLRLSVEAYIQPRCSELLKEIASHTGSRVPDVLTVSLSQTGDPPEAPDWHWVIVGGQTSGRQTAEKILVQVARQSLLGRGSYEAWHEAACQAIRKLVDPNYLCALYVLW
jgi:hypothetical protein